MNEQSGHVKRKIDYVKPVILDLGAVTAAYGAASCVEPGTSATVDCNPNGNNAGILCRFGFNGTPG